MNGSDNQTNGYPIGQKGIPWGPSEKSQWFHLQSVKRSYFDQVVSKLKGLDKRLTVQQYGTLPIDPSRYPLYLLSSSFDSAKPTALVTGGVHGYETSGVQGAIRFLQTSAAQYLNNFNLIVAPCISPWAYETVNRWNADAVDPNRSFYPNQKSTVEDHTSVEAASLMNAVFDFHTSIKVHVDLHETTDTDNTEFRPALAARDDVEHEIWDIPDGFYLVGDCDKPATDFQSHIVQAVSQVTHIAESDSDDRIIGEKISQYGVINYPTRDLGLCTGFSDCEFGTTTEVYPDSPRVDAENCIQAQVTAICSALDYVAKSG